MSTGTSATTSGLLMVPMMIGVMGTSLTSGFLMTRTGRYKIFPIIGTLVAGGAMVWMTTLTASTPVWLVVTMLFFFGFGLGLIMQVVVLVVQNAVRPQVVGAATSTNNYFREVGASLGVAVFGSLFTSHLSSKLRDIFEHLPASTAEALKGKATSITPAELQHLPESLRHDVVEAYANALAPVFWYLVPFMGIAFILSLLLKEIPLSKVSAMVACGEAVAEGSAADEAGVAEDEGARRSIAEGSASAAAGKTQGTGAPSTPVSPDLDSPAPRHATTTDPAPRHARNDDPESPGSGPHRD